MPRLHFIIFCAAAAFGLVFSTTLLADMPIYDGPHVFYTTDGYYHDNYLEDNHDGTAPNGVIGFGGVDTNNNLINPAEATITFGTKLVYQDDLEIHSNSTLNVNGGQAAVGTQPATPGGYLEFQAEVLDTSTVNIADYGTVQLLYAFDNSKVNMTAGALGTYNNGHPSGGLTLGGNSKATISGGVVTSIVLDSSANVGGGSQTLDFSGGTFGLINARGQGSKITVSNVDPSQPAGSVVVYYGATCQITGGTVSSVTASQLGSATVGSGATVTGSISADEGFLNINGPTFGSLSVIDPGSSAEMSGGTDRGGATVSQSATLAISGGTFGGDISASYSSTVAVGNANITGGISEADSFLNINPGTTTTQDVSCNNGQVTISSGVTIGGNLNASGQVPVTVSSASIAGSIVASGGAQVTTTGTTIGGSVLASDLSVLILSKGSVAGSINVTGNASVDLEDTTVTGVCNNSAINSFGFIMGSGSLGGLNASGSSTSTLAGGTITGAVTATGSSKVALSGANLQEGLQTHSNALVAISDGSVTGGVQEDGSSTVTWSGGTLKLGIFSVVVAGQSQFFWRGGVLRSTENPLQTVRGGPAAPPAPPQILPIYIEDSGSFTFNGINLTTTPAGTSSDGQFNAYSLSGMMGDGSAIPSGVEFFLPVGTTTASFSLGGSPQSWNNNSGGSWGTTANWSPGIVADGAGSNAVFNDSTTTTPITVTLDGNRTVGSIDLEGTHSYTIAPGSGGKLTVDVGNYAGTTAGDATINVVGNHQITAPVVVNSNLDIHFAPVTNNNVPTAGTLTITGGITIAEGQTLDVYGYNKGYGTLITSYIRGYSLNQDGGVIQIAPNGTAAGASYLEVYGYDVNFPNEISQIDLTNNALVAVLGNGYSASDLTSYFQISFDNGKWDGSGFTSSLAANDSRHLTAIGNADSNELHVSSYDGLAFDQTSDIMRYTYYGDANLDGKVDGSDYSLIDSGYLTGGSDWFHGDFNYDGVVNGSDYTLIDNAFNNQAAAMITAKVTTEVASVPEPATLGIMTALAALIYSRRRT